MVKGPVSCGAFPRLQRRAIELHDSKVVFVLREGGALRIRLSGVVHVSRGEPGTAAGTTWSQEVDLIVAGAVIEGALPADALWITEGYVELGGERLGMLPQALEHEGPVELELAGAEGRLLVRGTGLSIVPRGDPVFIERFPGAPLT